MLAAGHPASGRTTGDVRILADVPDTRWAARGDRLLARDEVRQLLSLLDERERSVLLAHYGLGNEPSGATFEQVGQRLGLTKQRVRQIEQLALAKLRIAATPAQSGR
jgi:DNA-directed RNA polymerase sigma subunit (sigma70/sigma32)